MMFHRLRLINRKQRGFTLIELLIAIAITSLITGGITAAIFQTFTVSARNNSHMTAVRQVQNAGHWISPDAQMAQDVNTDDNPGTPELELVTLTWTEWVDETVNVVTYIITVDDELKRSHFEDGSPTSEMIVARYIDSVTYDFTDTDGDGVDDTLTFTITAAVGDYPATVSETRVYKITPRPNI